MSTDSDPADRFLHAAVWRSFLGIQVQSNSRSVECLSRKNRLNWLANDILVKELKAELSQ